GLEKNYGLEEDEEVVAALIVLVCACEEVVSGGGLCGSTDESIWAKEADRRLARMINNVSVKLRAVIEEYQLFTQELEASPGWVVNKDRSIEYLQELVQRDEEMVQRLQALEREVEERADEKLFFIEKLKGNVPFE
ncbi:hypothetical protein Tco_0421286, partial [Tanacetum coccineum]